MNEKQSAFLDKANVKRQNTNAGHLQNNCKLYSNFANLRKNELNKIGQLRTFNMKNAAYVVSFSVLVYIYIFTIVHSSLVKIKNPFQLRVCSQFTSSV